MIDVLAKSILDKLVSFSGDLTLNYVVEGIKAAKYVKKDLKVIAEKMEAISVVLEDAEEKECTNKAIKIWLRDLKTVFYDIDDLLDEVAYDVKLRKANEGHFARQLRYFVSSSNPIISPFFLSNKLKGLREKLDNIVAKKNEFGLAEHRVDSSLRDEIRDPFDGSPFVHKPTIIGRDEAMQDILHKVSNVGDASELSVLPIVGMGGVGKTTLAKLVYAEVHNFDLKLWACVSDKFQIRQIIEDIVKDGRGGIVISNQDLNTLVKKLHGLLKDQKYFLVLDDVWEEDVAKWRQLRDLLTIGKAGSIILITTRKANVAYITKTNDMEPYDLDRLPERVCWSIFKGLAFMEGEEARYPQLCMIGKSIIKKCRGIPLVVITLGSLLRGKRDSKEWKHIDEMDSFVGLNQQYEKVIQILKISYDKLPSHLKPCFAYLSLYAKDAQLHTNYVPYMWSALGLLRGNNENKFGIEDYGYSYLMELVSRSLLEEPDYQIDKLYCVSRMHDILHDLAMNILGEELSVVNLDSMIVSELSRHIVWGYELCDSLQDKEFPIELFKARNARTFRFGYKMNVISRSFLKGIISHLKCLRFLQLNGSWFWELPKSIGKLKHLRYLDLSDNPLLRTLPNTICKLFNLEYLNVYGCELLKQIPKDIFQLQSLRFFGVTTCQVSFIGTKLKELSCLHTLSIDSCAKLEALWENDNGGGLFSLRILSISCCQNLRCLPKSMKYLVNLQILSINNCEMLDMEEAEGLQGLQSLRTLELIRVPKMIYVPDSISSSAASLEYLKIEKCWELVQLPEWLQHFTSLREFEIEGCPGILRLPSGFHNLTSLQLLVIENCPELSTRCDHLNGIDYPLIQHIPNFTLDGV